MRILIASNLYPPDIGGPATYARRLALELYRRGIGVAVVAVSSNEARREPFPLFIIPRSLPLPIRFFQAFRRLLKEGKKADFIYSNCLDAPAVLAAKILRKPLLVKIVGDQAWEKARVQGLLRDDVDDFQARHYGFRLSLLKFYRTIGPKFADLVLTPSRYLKKMVAGWGIPEAKIQVVHNAAEVSETSPDELNRALENLNPGVKDFLLKPGMVLLALGRLLNWKGNDLAIRALKQLPEEIRLLIVGEGPDRGRLETLAKEENLQSRVCFAGKADRKTVALFLKKSFALIQPTGYEGLPHTVIEAQAMGCPVITTDKCGNPEAVTHLQNGLLVPFGDLDAFVQAVLTLLRQDGLRETLIAGGLQSAKYFNWERLLQETLPIFEALSLKKK